MRLLRELKIKESKKKVAAASEDTSAGVDAETKTHLMDSDRGGNALVPYDSSQFQVLKADSADRLMDRLKRRCASSKLTSKFGNTSLQQIIRGDDEENEDFYLYRQPHLNKSIWETKPRPYR